MTTPTAHERPLSEPNSSWWRCDATPPDGGEIHTESRGSELLRRQPDGRWLVLVDNPGGVG